MLFVGFAFRDADVAAVIFNAIRQRSKEQAGRPTRMKIVIVDPYIDVDQFVSELAALERDASIPMKLRDLDVVTIRSEFPPSSDKEIKAILSALER